jgi:hypothetical protein
VLVSVLVLGIGIGIGYRYWYWVMVLILVLVFGIGIVTSLDYSRLQIVSYTLVIDTWKINVVSVYTVIFIDLRMKIQFYSNV